MRVVVTIDGPAGSGKSTIAAALARELAVPHVDTGAYYRAATLAVLRAGVDPEDERACVRIAAAADIRRSGTRTLLEGQDVERQIRGPDVTAAVSAVSRHRGVRRALVALQRQQVAEAGAVVEGRDAGTVVAPDAALKVWLTASPRDRAARRASQLGELDPRAVARHAADIARRDAADAAQMRRAPDAVAVDTTGRDIARIVDELAARAREAAGACKPRG